MKLLIEVLLAIFEENRIYVSSLHKEKLKTLTDTKENKKKEPLLNNGSK